MEANLSNSQKIINQDEHGYEVISDEEMHKFYLENGGTIKSIKKYVKIKKSIFGKLMDNAFSNGYVIEIPFFGNIYFRERIESFKSKSIIRTHPSYYHLSGKVFRLVFSPFRRQSHNESLIPAYIVFLPHQVDGFFRKNKWYEEFKRFVETNLIKDLKK